MSREAGDGRGRLGGRTKGTPNKKTFDARRKAEELGIDPLEVLLYYTARDWKALGFDSEYRTSTTKDGEIVEVPVIPAKLQAECAKQATKFLYPVLKAIEISGNQENPLEIYMTMSSEERMKRIRELTNRIEQSKSQRELIDKSS